MEPPFRVGDWLVSPRLNRVEGNGRAVRVEPKVMQVLVCLAERPGEVFSKEVLLRKVWPDTFVTDEVLTRAISELRRVFEDDAKAPHGHSSQNVASVCFGSRGGRLTPRIQQNEYDCALVCP